ncbi:nuclear transport factor 2 family protein [Mucilaginibacter myungsuensis]|uniref:Nuclear transport factor 2 family protein n=1 Tax=Mucilaginibacter myungsuensis TaxID=649104 RepID=A0A929L0W7_9SPHI|nr:nuclear transport factor 2 family protein [Mucilaginibacter myungsuensis]MBE9661231.1 nuclear transport factor 2 family protein [Mucilaginibacter myungsuensis]MDN3597375.1 nuclear transport factor 2 family protein [Mucilaginibacter myungsuensis]
MDNKTILTTANEFVLQGDHESFLAYCTDDTEWNFIGDQILSGKQAVREYMKETYVEPPQFDVKDLIAEGEFVTAIGKISLKDKSGKMTNYEYCDVWHFREGKLAGLRAFVVEIK